jgi:lysozyme family protein
MVSGEKLSELLQVWLTRILGHEGGEVDDPDDPGGHTKWGISKRAYPDLDISSLTVEDAAKIYLRDYASPLRLWRFEDGVAFQLFDFAVNSGPRTAVKQLQAAVGVEADGVIGPITLAAIASRSEAVMIMLVLAERLDFMASLRTFPTHGRGWARRIAQNLRYGAEDTE